MTTPDFAAILAVALTSASPSGCTVDSPPVAALYALNATVPALCGTCEGKRWIPNAYGPTKSCPDCPTIQTLLDEAAEARRLRSECTCGWGGQHDADNPRCRANQET